MSHEFQQDQRATRRGVLLGVGIAGIGGVLAGWSTAAVPYDADEAGTAPGQQAQAASSTAAMAGQPAAQGSGAAMGTLLGQVTDIPVGGGKVFPSQKVVVTPQAKGEFKAFSAICTTVEYVSKRGRERHDQLPLSRQRVQDHQRRGRRRTPTPLRSQPARSPSPTTRSTSPSPLPTYRQIRAART